VKGRRCKDASYIGNTKGLPAPSAAATECDISRISAAESPQKLEIQQAGRVMTTQDSGSVTMTTFPTATNSEAEDCDSAGIGLDEELEQFIYNSKCRTSQLHLCTAQDSTGTERYVSRNDREPE
jgi:hypothetical protein